MPKLPPAERTPPSMSLHRLSPRARLMGCIGSLIIIAALFISPLLTLIERAWRVDLDSYILIVPFISGYLLRIGSGRLPRSYFTSPVWAASFTMAGVLLLVKSRAGTPAYHEEGGDALTWAVAAFVCWIMAAGFLFLGRAWMSRAAFPVAFLAFMIPLPSWLLTWLETGSKVGSTEAAGWFFDLSGMPYLRDGFFFHLPDFTIEVAQECSGIRSSLILFITSLLAAHLFLRGSGRRLILVACVIPLAILRNGFRIWVIGELCVQVGPEMIHSGIHKHGGPLFFALSLVPLLLLAWRLRRGEKKTDPGPATN